MYDMPTKAVAAAATAKNIRKPLKSMNVAGYKSREALLTVASLAIKRDKNVS